MIKKALIVEDDANFLKFLKLSLERLNISSQTANNGLDALKLIQKESFDLIITDIKMPQKNGFEVLKHVKKHSPHTIVIVISAYAKTKHAIKALQEGAFNYLVKPFDFETLKVAIEKAKIFHDRFFQSSLNQKASKKDQKTLKNSSEKNTLKSLSLKVDKNLSFHKSHPKSQDNHLFNQSDIIASSQYMQDLLKTIDKIAKSSSSVFISGESGTGKEVIANLIFKKSKRAKKPFIKVNVAAISPTLLESEFFGHEKGSFTGADSSKKGRFELADTGTILLDEITEIPINLQAKLLRVLQEKELERVGSCKPIKIDVRVISISNQNISKAIEKNNFREDLFYRLNVIPIKILPLRKRKEDILPLANFFLQKLSKENNQPLKKLSKEAKSKLLNYDYPGNVRELCNIIERAVVMDKSLVILKEHLILDNTSLSNQNNLYELDKDLIDKKIKDVEKVLILQTLKNHKYNKTKAAKILGISTRTLRNKLELYDLK